MSTFNCCFLTCIQVSQEAGKMVWYSHLFKNFPQLVVIHIEKGVSVVNEAEVDGFLEFPCFLYDPVLSRQSHVQLFAVLWTIALQTHLSMGFFRQEYWSGLPCPGGIFLTQGSNPCLLCLLHCQAGSSPSATWESLLSNECWQFDHWFLCLF